MQDLGEKLVGWVDFANITNYYMIGIEIHRTNSQNQPNTIFRILNSEISIKHATRNTQHGLFKVNLIVKIIRYIKT